MRISNAFNGKHFSPKQFRRRLERRRTRRAPSRVVPRRHPKVYERSVDTKPSKTWKFFVQGVSIGIVVGIVAGIVYTLIYSPLFRVRNIVITGTTSQELEQMVKESIENAILGYTRSIFPNDNILLLDKSHITQSLAADVASVDHVRVSVRWPNTLHGEVIEKERVLLWNNGGKTYDIDSTGTVLRETQQSRESTEQPLPQLNDERTDITIKPGMRIASPMVIAFATQLPDVLAKYTRLEVERMSTPNPATREIHVETREGWLLLLDASRNPENEMKTLNKVVEEMLAQEEISNIEYIDLRVRERVFYKLRNNTDSSNNTTPSHSVSG